MNPIEEYLEKEKKKNKIETYLESQGYKQTYQPKMTTSSRQYRSKNDFIKSTSSKAFFNNKQDENKRKIEEIFNNRRAENNTKEQENKQNTPPKLTEDIIKEYSNSFNQNMGRLNQNTTGTNLNKNYNRTQNQQKKPIVPMKINTEELQDPQKVTWNDIKARKEAEQINEDIKKGDYSSSIGHILNSFLGGVKQSASGIASTVLLPIGGVTKKLSESNIVNDKWKEKLSDFSDDVFDASEYIGEQGNYSSNVNSQVDNNIVKTGGQVSNVLGNLATSVLANVIAPGSGATVNAVTVGGNSAQETLNEDRDNVAQSMLTGATKGYISKKVEGITGGNFLSKGNLDDLATRTIEKNIKSNLGKEIATRGYQVLGEMGEEQIEDNLGYVVDKLINDKDLPDFQEWWNQTGETNKVTFLSTLALQMVGLGGSTRNNSENIYSDVDTKTANKWINEAKKIIEKENINTSIQTTQNSPIIPINKNQNTNQNVQEVQSTPIVPFNQERQNTQENVSNNSPINAYAEENNFLNNNIVPLRNNTENTELGTDIKRINQNHSTSAEAFSTSLVNSNNNIAPLKDNINTSNQIVENPTQMKYNTNIDNEINLQQSNDEGVGGDYETVQRLQRLSGQFDTRLQQNSEQQQIKRFTREEYEQWEKSIKPIAENNITNEQQQIKKDIKRQYNKDIVFFSNNNNDKYTGGASLTDKNKIYLDANEVQTFGTNRVALHEVMESEIRHNKELKEDIIIPVIDTIIKDTNFEKQKSIFWKNQPGEMPGDYAIAKDILCDRFAELKTGEKWDYDNVLSQETNMNIDLALENFYKSIYGKDLTQDTIENKITSNEEMNTPIVPINKKTMNPTEISNIKPEEASTTPKLPNRNYEKGNKQSSFYNNLITDSKFLSEDFRKAMSQDENIKYYREITNKDTLEKAYKELQEGGEKDVIGWFSKDGKNADATDVSKGWILLKEYQDNGDFENAVRVAKKMRDIGTTAGQTIQAFNIMSRLTPEGMTMYAQSELTEAYNKMVKGKTQKWIDKNASKFDLSPSETAFIKNTMEQVATMEDGYDKKVKLAEIQKVITDKIPPTAGQSIKSWMRISMLFNPKTQIRNVAGNAVVLPLNTFSDMFASAADKAIARKTGVRTTGNINLKSYAKGFGKGIYESYNDFRKGINTRNIQGNRFEVSEGKNFKDKGIGKALNRVDNMLSFMLDAGDRGFYEASFNNSINNQMVLNNSTEITQEMIDIATNEALQRTWQDNNAYTQTVLSIRNALNGKVSFKGREISNGMEYGAGDVLIPFAKTPANLTKAIVDYSPLGLIKTLAYDARKLVNSINTNQYTPQIQHTFVQNLGKSFSGSFLYVLAYGLAKAGIITGEADDDKDVKNFMKNSLGISSYSIKIGNKTFTYDWAQPIAAPFAIMSNWVKKQKDNPDASIIEKAINAIGTGFDVMLEQSFMESINSVLNGSGSTIENIQNAVLELPARAVPTFSKQIADMVDGTQRTTFEYDRPVKSAINSVIAKIPFASKNLSASRDTLGNEIKKYGGENNVFNVFINPANTNKGELSKAGEEIYKVYQETGETDIFPITAPYYVNSNGDKVTMDSEQRAEYQKVAGTYVEDTLDALLSNSTYKNLTTSQKADLIADIVSDSNARAKHKVLNIESEDAKKKRTFIDKIQPQNYYDYQVKTKDLETNKEKIKVLADSNYSNSVKSTIYEETTGKSDELYQILKKDKININEYLKYKEQEFESDRKDDGTTSGKAISGSKKKKVYNYVNNMNITYKQKLLLLGTQYKLTTNERKELAYYVNSLPNTTKKDKLKIYEKLKGFTVYKNGTVSW